MDVVILNRQRKQALQTAMWKQKTTKILSGLGCTDRDVSVVFVSDKKIHEFNRQFRDMDKPTDVLSFPAESQGEPFDDILPLGDVIISVETAARQAEEYGHSFEAEIDRLLVHGLLHLLGYDHINADERKVMRRKEASVLKKLQNA